MNVYGDVVEESEKQGLEALERLFNGMSKSSLIHLVLWSFVFLPRVSFLHVVDSFVLYLYL